MKETVVLIMVLLGGKHEMHDERFATLDACSEYAEKRADVKSYICMDRGGDPKVEAVLRLEVEAHNERTPSEGG